MNPHDDSKPASLLIVDDTVANLRLLSDVLKREQYKVRSVTSGAMALIAAKSAPPDLILLDINMPQPNGFEVCRQLKNDALTCDIPVLFISALEDISEKLQAFSVGGVDYITKPIEQQEVLARVRTHLRLHQLQRQQRQHNAELEQGIQELDAFAHTVAHDLRNPLTAIMGYTEMVRRELSPGTLVSAKAAERLRAIAEAARRMNNIIDALLLLSSVSQHKQIDRKPIDMAEIIHQVMRRLAFMIEEYQASITLSDSWPQAIGYSPWIEEVWANYLSNGLKYGGRPPHLELGAERQTDKTILFWVQDNGPGISPDAQQQLFTPFTRLHQNKAEGHGLGLSIVQRIVSYLDGEVGLHSSEGQGSRFFFTLPAVDSD